MTSDSDSDYDIPLAAMATNGSKKKSSAKKKIASKKTTATKRKRDDSKPDKVASSSTKAKKTKKTTAAPVKKELKKLDKAERLQYAMQSFLWWNAKEPPAGCQWEKMEHAGVSFPESYQPHRVRMKYDGKPVNLTPVQEEA